MTDSKPEAGRPPAVPQAEDGSRRIGRRVLALAVVLALAGGLYWGVAERDLPEPAGQTEAPGTDAEPEAEVAAGDESGSAAEAVPAEVPQQVAAPEVEPGAEAVAEAAPGTDDLTVAEAAPGTGDAATADNPQAPAFDLVRVERDGSAVIAGTAAPGARVTIRSDAEPLAEAEADADGNFVAIFRADPGAAPQALTLDAEAPDGTQSRSDEVVMLLPDAPVAEAAGSGEAAADAAPEGGAETGEPAIAATAVVRADGAVEVTPTAAPAPQSGAARQVTLSTIAYSEAGEVTLSGLGTPAAGLRAYVDGALSGEAAVAGDGRWALELDDLAEGLYRLRIDALDAEGRVTSRVETPFQRDFPAAPLPRPGVEGAVAQVIDGAVTVQPGNTLWTLARVHYGSGVLFTQIFTANSELIRDPDLIYPGQVLALPGAEEAD